MRDRPVSLQLAEQIMALFQNSGATQLEQLAALDVARALVPVSGSSLIEPAEGAGSSTGEPEPDWPD